ncbi:hypothetical protein OHS59_43845 [Streptomyces sp. NBC_00414]|uniref:hypothetical protein n=1 Tax=Streptomyces sp. NBC_00414 TaxID=2975739 RepID=UPI002E1EE3F3
MAGIGRAADTIDAYGRTVARSVQDRLRLCAVEGTDPVLAGADTVAELVRCAGERGRQVAILDGGHGEVGQFCPVRVRVRLA